MATLTGAELVHLLNYFDFPADADTYTSTAEIAALGGGADPTAARPASPAVGRIFFDTTLGLPIWWNGADWINAAGATV